MKNPDKPAYPVNQQVIADLMHNARDNNIDLDHAADIIHGMNGLTKRERFAIAAMQGLCNSDTNKSRLFEDVAFEAVRFADETLKKLEETQ